MGAWPPSAAQCKSDRLSWSSKFTVAPSVTRELDAEIIPRKTINKAGRVQIIERYCITVNGKRKNCFTKTLGANKETLLRKHRFQIVCPFARADDTC